MLTFQWLLIGTTACLTIAAWFGLRRLRAKLERLSQAYWELRYEHGQLSARLARLEQPGDGPPRPDEDRPPAQTAFVPLSSLRK